MAVTLVLIGWLVPYVANTRTSGAEGPRDPWVFILIAPCQLFVLVIVSAAIFIDGAARDRIPMPWRDWLTVNPRFMVAPRPGWPNDQPMPGRVTEFLQAVYWVVFGAIYAFFGTLVQIAMTAMLFIRPQTFSPLELLVVGTESALAAAWIAFLARAMLDARRPTEPEAT